MSITVPCPRCGYTIKAPDANAGKAVVCAACRNRVPVPATKEADEDEWSDEGAPAPKKKLPVLPLVIGGGLAVAAIVAGFALSGALTGKKPPRPVLDSPQQRLALPLVVPAPANEDGDPFRPTEETAAAAVTALDKLAARAPALPQDAARAAALRAARLEWSRNTMDRAFDRAGRADAPWAPKARDALSLRARELAVHPEFALQFLTSDASDAALTAAVAAGCDDPLVLYYHHKALVSGGGLTDARLAEARRFTRRLWDSEYPDVRKAYAVHNLLVALRERGAPADEVAAWNGRFWDALGRLCTEKDDIAQDHVAELAHLREDYSRLIGGTRQRGHEEFVAALARAEAPEYTRKVVQGAFLIRHAWDARGSGTADTVTPNGFRMFAERLEAAEAALTAAHKLAPDRPHAPTRMLTVCMGRGHPHAEMEVWFERAMRADPDNLSACSAKLEYLQPKWYGTAEDHIGFAWQCVRTRNAVGMLPYGAVGNITGNAPIIGPMTPALAERLQMHYGHAQVWQVLHAGLTTLRRERPDVTWLRAEHVRLACVAGRHDIATRALAGVGDYRSGGFLSADELTFYQQWAKTGRPPAP